MEDSKKGFFRTIQDIVFYTFIGLIFLIIFGWIMSGISSILFRQTSLGEE